jgi:hypothetical protein
LQSARVDVLGSFAGAPSTVALIKRYALEAQRDPSVRLLAETIVSQLSSKDTTSEILSVYYFLLRHCRYASDPRTVELLKRPEWLVRQIASGQTPSIDCDDFTCLGAALQLSLGREVRAVTVAFRNSFHGGERQFSHVYLSVREGRTGHWITLDPVAAEDTNQMLNRVVAMKIWPIA